MAGYRLAPSARTPWRTASENCLSVYLPMPCVVDGVMLVATMAPSGVARARPPAIGLPPGTLWQAMQSPAVAR
jgi:hypothetical protein